MKIKTNDMVIVLAGKDKGRTGKVIRWASTESVIVEGVNIIKKCIRPNPQKNEQGGIVDREAAIHVSNVAIYNPTTKKADRIGYKFLEDGRKVRYYRSNDEMIE